MTNELTTNPTALSVWESEEALTQIRNSYAKDLSHLEFDLFVSMGRATGLNPFLREIWAVKYDKHGSANIFIGRDGYRKSAQRHPLYDYHTSDAVYSRDVFTVVDGEPRHQYDLNTNRGALIGAYAVAKRKGSSKPSFVFVNINEYNLGQSIWKSKPATMIKKVAEAQALRMCFQELFAGTYDECEDWVAKQARLAMDNPQKGINGLRERLGLPIVNKAPAMDDEELDVYTDYTEKDFTYDAIVNMIKESLNLRELKASGELAKNFSTEERERLRPIYEQRRNELKTQFTNMESNQCHTHSTLSQ